MKCIRNTRGKIERVNDNKAFELVSTGKAEYVAKNVWKREVRDAKE